MGRERECLRVLVLTRVQPAGASSSAGGQLAKALYIAAELATQAQKGKVNVHEAVAKDLKILGDVLATPEWQVFFSSPVIAKEARLATLNEMWSKIGASEVVRQFFARLVESKQTKHVKEMLAAYQHILRLKRSEVEATVVSAAPFSAREVEKVRAVIVDEFLEGNDKATIVLKQEVDPSLLFGYTLTVGSAYIDRSVKSRLDQIKESYASIMAANEENALRRNV